MFQDIFYVPLRIDETEIVINCRASDVAQVSKMKRKQGRSTIANKFEVKIEVKMLNMK